MADVVEAPDVAGFLRWGVMERFLGYVRRSGGTVTVHEPCVWDDGTATFVFPLQHLDMSSGTTTAEFDGAIRMVAHGGALDVLLLDPAIELGPGVSRLTVETEWDTELVRIEIANLEFGPHFDPRTGLVQDAVGEATLSGRGPAWLGNVYPAGTPIAPVSWLVRSKETR